MLPAASQPSKLLAVLVPLVAAVLALGVPAGYFAAEYAAFGAALQTRADVKAEVINQAIGNSPEMWRFEEHRLSELLVRLPIELKDEHARIVADDGTTVAQSRPALPRLAALRSADLFDAGRHVGTVEVRRSLHALLTRTAMIAVLACTLGGLLLGALRRVQAREQRLADERFGEQERARVTLQSIGDALFTTDVNQRVEYLNPVAERLTQWTLAAARGRAIAEVCPLIDERTMQAVAAPVAEAMRAGQPRPFSGNEVALVKRDGTSIAVEDAAAPIHDRQGAVIGSVMVLRDVSTTRRLAQRIAWAASHDALTGLVNRREFEARVEAALGSAHTGATHALCYLDLDQFKLVNDTCGHAAGDTLLKQIAGVLQARLRQSDTLARLGGDEFGVLLEGCPLERASLIAADLLAAVRDIRFTWAERTFTASLSVGIVAIDAGSGTRAELFSAADAACYAAKEQGRNRACVYQHGDAEIARRRDEMGWAARLTSALEEERLRLYYQPYMPLGQQSAGGTHIEILLRLIDEAGKLVSPGSFVPAAERYNLMPAIDRWVVKTVFARYHALRVRFGGTLTCAINLSGATVNAEGVLEFIQEQARAHAIPPGAICFEITETAAINNLRRAAEFMRAIKAVGFCFALDDFGVGTSSLAYLKTLPVDYLKIDGSFVRNIANDPVDRAMAETINRVGHIMGLQTVGEFAESPEIIGELRALGVDFAQGYGVQRPEPLPDDVALAGTVDAPAADAT